MIRKIVKPILRTASIFALLCCVFTSQYAFAEAKTSWWNKWFGKAPPAPKEAKKEPKAPDLVDTSKQEKLEPKPQKQEEYTKKQTQPQEKHIPKQTAVAKETSNKPKKQKTKTSSKSTSKMKNYVRADVVIAIPTQNISGFHGKKPDHDVGGSLGLGRIFTDRIRGDITATFNQYLYKTGPGNQNGKEYNHLTSVVFMTNGYFHLTKDKMLTSHITKISPYLMAGIGIAVNKIDDWTNEVPNNFRHLGDTSQNFAWQVGAGALFKIKDNIDADLMYKYADLGRTITKNFQSVDMGVNWTRTNDQKKCLRVHEISVGIFFKL